MIKKLRRKFILINMLLVSVVLLIVFATVCLSTYQRLKEESHGAMQQALGREMGAPVPRPEIGGRRPGRPFPTVPVFCVLLDADGRVLWVWDENVTVSAETAAQAAQAAFDAGGRDGVLSGLALRFLRQNTREGIKIAFADLSGERRSMAGIVVTSLLVGLGGLAAFFIISLFLAAWALRPAQRAWERQRQFVADASHELKTPLTVILANTGILLSHRDDTIGRQLKWVENTQAEANRMKKLVDDLLFLAKSDDKRMEGEHVRLNLSDAVWSSFLPFESVAFEKGVALSGEIAPDIFVTGDEAQLKQLAAILLDNALKYAGEQGGVTLTLQKTQDRARLLVHNTGAPIAPGHLNNLFERFYRTDDARTREQGGYGLGLSIAKSIAEKHGGKISVESAPHTGTTFSVWLPAAKQ